MVEPTTKLAAKPEMAAKLMVEPTTEPTAESAESAETGAKPPPAELAASTEPTTLTAPMAKATTVPRTAALGEAAATAGLSRRAGPARRQVSSGGKRCEGRCEGEDGSARQTQGRTARANNLAATDDIVTEEQRGA